jgi:hypothetical protein
LPDEHYSYLIGALIFVAAWVGCYLVGKRYRPQIIWGTLVSVPFALTSLLFIPQYWSPPSLFDLDTRIHVGIEDFLWAAAVGGIGSVLGEIILRVKLSQTRGQGRKRHIVPFVVVAVLFALLEWLHPNKTIYNMVIAFAVGAVVVAFLRPDLIQLMLTGAMNFTALYPDFIQRYYNIPHLLGIYIFKVPIEELLFASTGGAIWSVAYEYLQGYRLAPGATFRLARIEHS